MNAVLAALGWIFVGAGLWHVVYSLARTGFGRAKPTGTSARSPEDAALGSILRGERTLDNGWLAGTLIGIGLVFVGHESRNDVLTDAALYSTTALQVLNWVLAARRRRKLQALLRDRRSRQAAEARPAMTAGHREG